MEQRHAATTPFQTDPVPSPFRSGCFFGLARAFLCLRLRDEGHDVIHASSGEDALTWCKRRIADVLITDIRLPGHVDGWQIAERCREHDPGLPVIYATGFSPVQHRPVPAACPCRSLFIHSTSSTPSRSSQDKADLPEAGFKTSCPPAFLARPPAERPAAGACLSADLPV
jgi:CheY-like chemotaxis protein